MKSYNFSQCENPRVIRNKYTGQYLRVGCGICKGCSLQRRDQMSLLCSQEETKHRYTLFVTLTYNSDCIPLLQPFYKNHGNRQGFRFFNLCHRLNTLGSMVHFEPDTFHKNHEWLNNILRKTNLNGFLPYTCKRDAQLFLKRFRKFLSKFSDEKIKYYLVSEYGPKHFRPHFHILFYFDTKATKNYIGRCIKLAWAYHQKTKKTTKQGTTKTIYKLRRYGRIDYQITNGNARNYVAGYVNSSVCLPSIYKTATFAKPFVLHSKNFGNPILQSEKEKIYDDEYYRFTQRSRQNNEKLSTYELQSTFKSRFFPRCRGYNSKSLTELFQSYTCFTRLRQEFQTDNVTALANNIWFMLHQNIIPSYLKPFKYILQCPDYLRLANAQVNRHDLFINRIKSDLYLSKHFYEFVCDSDIRLYHKRLSQIIKFWDYEAIKKLKQFYTTQQEFIETYPNNTDFIPFMYDNFEVYFAEHLTDYKGDIYSFSIYENFEAYCIKVFNDMFNVRGTPNIKFRPLLKTHSMFDIIQYDVSMRFERSIKHKKQNDINKILIEE